MSDSAQSLWPHAGYAQLKTDARGHLTVTDDFLRVLLPRGMMVVVFWIGRSVSAAIVLGGDVSFLGFLDSLLDFC